MSSLAFALLAASDELTGPAFALHGKWFFVGALALLLVWLVCMPRRLIGQAKETVPWWRNVRLWAITLCVIQMLVYICYA